LQEKLTFRAQLRHEAHEGDLGIDEGVEQIMEGGVALKVHHDQVNRALVEFHLDAGVCCIPVTPSQKAQVIPERPTKQRDGP
jgi:hypothetical protein